MQCQACQRFTITRKGYHPYSPILARLPWDHISFDLLELPTSVNGYNFALVVVDVCTRFVLIRPLRTKEAQSVAVELYKIFTDFGFPRIWQSDNGREFLNKVLAQMKEYSSAEHRTITPYNPRANGLSERFVRTIKDSLFKELQGAETDWDKFIPKIQYCMNIKVQALHNSSPFSLFFARKMNYFGDYQNAIFDPLQTEELNRRLTFMNDIVFPSVHSKSQEMQAQRSADFNSKHSLINLPIGAMVMTSNSVKTGKGSARYEGPYKVLRRAMGGSYELTDSQGALLPRKYAPNQIKIVSPADLEDERESFIVEKILQHKIESGKKFYLCKWKGYSSASNSWTAEDDFDDLEIIRNYWKSKSNCP